MLSQIEYMYGQEALALSKAQALPKHVRINGSGSTVSGKELQISQLEHAKQNLSGGLRKQVGKDGMRAD